jgi:MoxR-like ATPase
VTSTNATHEEGLLPDGVHSPADLAPLLRAHGYLADAGTTTAAFLALRLGRPLFLEGEAGVGKTALAHALSAVLSAPLIRLQCYEGIDASQALYDWDFPRQLLHLKAVEAAGELTGDVASVESSLYDRRYLVARPLLQAIETTPSVLLIDEVDRADDEFEAFLLEVLSEFSITIPELGTVSAVVPPVVVLTGNRTRDVSDALKRRCLYHWLDHPTFERELDVLRLRVPEATDLLCREVVAVTQHLRSADLVKPPGLAETLDWTRALVALDVESLAEADVAVSALGALLKHRDDAQRVRKTDMEAALSAAIGLI